MPFSQKMNSDLVVEPSSAQTRRGIFRNRTPVTASKFSNNAVPMKPNRKKFQSKILNRRDPSAATDVKLKSSGEDVLSNALKKPSGLKDFTSEVTTDVDIDLSSLLLRIDHCTLLDKTTISLSKTLVTKSSSKRLEPETTSSVTPKHETTLLEIADENDTKPCNQAVSQNGSQTSLLWNAGCLSNTSLKKFPTFIKDDNVVKKKSKKSSIPVVMPAQAKIGKRGSSSGDVPYSEPTVDDLDVAEKFQHSVESENFNQSDQKYDQEARDVISRLTESLKEKMDIIGKYEEQLSMFSGRITSLQTQLDASLERTKQIELTMTDSASSKETKSEVEGLKEKIKKLETKLTKRDLHIFNLKQVLCLETRKIKELNKAQEEINSLQRESIDKSREISVLRDELKYAANMRAELMNEYDEKIVKLKKLLAIREYLLLKAKS